MLDHEKLYFAQFINRCKESLYLANLSYSSRSTKFDPNFEVRPYLFCAINCFNNFFKSPALDYNKGLLNKAPTLIYAIKYLKESQLRAFASAEYFFNSGYRLFGLTSGNNTKLTKTAISKSLNAFRKAYYYTSLCLQSYLCLAETYSKLDQGMATEAYVNAMQCDPSKSSKYQEQIDSLQEIEEVMDDDYKTINLPFAQLIAFEMPKLNTAYIGVMGVQSSAAVNELEQVIGFGAISPIKAPTPPLIKFTKEEQKDNNRPQVSALCRS